MGSIDNLFGSSKNLKIRMVEFARLAVVLTVLRKISFAGLFVWLPSTCYGWESNTYPSKEGLVHVAFKRSSTDPSVSLVLACVAGRSNATVSIDTGNLVLGLPNNTMSSAYVVGNGSIDGKGSGPAMLNSRIREDAMGFYLGEAQQGLGMAAMISNNDWLKIYWDFVAPNRGRMLKEIFGQPAATPQRQYTFDLRGFHRARDSMAQACRWPWVK
jgi:hypothetical protein